MFYFTSYKTRTDYSRIQSSKLQFFRMPTEMILVFSKYKGGRAIAQADSRRLPTAEARVQSQIKSCGICGEQSGNGTGFLRMLRCPLPILVPPNVPYSSIIPGWYNRPVTDRRTKWTQSKPNPPN
jgi:hypothetical protein